ncbi:MAG: phospho-N-acetylmuramoyl-pentapeptide-transferase [Anaerolineae bacterium]|jgi:phospho-N-acetylmuramoyl-pentapeptide-transferase|nr:phospho-N-acetylmuramoyl-pentapeptide-transferase [Anaerolineae bacterium]MBT3714538.1 phospho-N-acetylmuramoyl-pentapeptide-transferase [Anaerolineae bacterium]MBT4310705.1 phospho-N-acetylmuramoyl-pentapeptide-transferase [Anaerolineae bacterium]MBT4457881.1 phospho-N-acetylmuramoyl-pentapeptide-transferase [Anaerolineae bacterium]MBT4842070.1 phospho-N-acetylmuramoyl-pentapeptide-transferase [Anaerolineae bacterium]
MTQMSLALSLAGLSFMMTVIWGPPLLRILRHFKIGKIIRVDEPGFHQVKMGTPTMGGVLFILPVALITVMLNAVSIIGMQTIGRSILVPLIVMFAYAILGALDDWEGIRGKRRGDGMRARTKFTIQVILAIATAAVLKYMLEVPELILPGVQAVFDLGIWYVPLAAFIIIGASNAINFTDGLDGLAGLIAATAFITYGGIALLQGQIFVGRFSFTIVGALFGFLWFNVHPASLFMGDTGSLSLGATLAVVALMTGQWAILPLIAIVPVSEALSVIIQVGYFKLTRKMTGEGKRFFKMAPIHLHFELLGWSETQVVQRFWLISLLSAMLGVGLALV